MLKQPVRFAALLSLAALTCLSTVPAAAWAQKSETRSLPAQPDLPLAPLPSDSALTDMMGVEGELKRLEARSFHSLDIIPLPGIAPLPPLANAPGANFAFVMPDMGHEVKALSEAMRTQHELLWAEGVMRAPGDSLYRVARQALNSGEYRRASDLLAQFTRQYPESQYRFDAAYWRAFALYRIGGIADLHEALRVLDSASKADTSHMQRSQRSGARSRTIAPPAKTRQFIFNAVPGDGMFIYSTTSDAEVAVLATRIRGALAARGDEAAAAAIAKMADRTTRACDEEDTQVRIEALNVLSQMDSGRADPAIAKVLASPDSCGVPLRRVALGLMTRSLKEHNKLNEHNTTLLINAARHDPSNVVRAEAIQLLGNVHEADATNALLAIARLPGQDLFQRLAVRALVEQQSQQSRAAIVNLMQDSTVTSAVRVTALYYAAKDDLTIGDLVKIYDAAADLSTHRYIIAALATRTEPAATDKLIDIARTSTDPSLRKSAIAALAQKKDPRTTKLLTDIIEK